MAIHRFNNFISDKFPGFSRCYISWLDLYVHKTNDWRLLYFRCYSRQHAHVYSRWNIACSSCNNYSGNTSNGIFSLWRLPTYTALHLKILLSDNARILHNYILYRNDCSRWRMIQFSSIFHFSVSTIPIATYNRYKEYTVNIVRNTK